jgi:hypothetical protein
MSEHRYSPWQSVQMPLPRPHLTGRFSKPRAAETRQRPKSIVRREPTRAERRQATLELIEQRQQEAA